MRVFQKQAEVENIIFRIMKVHLLFFTFVWCDVYTGKSYKDHGIFDITVTSAAVGDVLKSLDTTFSLDWLKPHEGATYTIGTKTSILVDPEDKDAFQTVLQEQGGINYTV